ncbi:MAG: haloacid dehalogenase type II [Tabrizicola sp.]|nr:haloacid dehalogenase type II [Tabrizicola sp.]
MARLAPPPTVVAFDVYGTLLDVHSAVQRLLPGIGPDAAQFSALWRTKQLEYTWVRSLAGRYRDFRLLTEDALDFAFAAFPAVDRALRPALLDAYQRLSAYPEAAATLRRLRANGLSLGVLSNGDPQMLDDALTAAGLTGLVDAVLSVQDAGVFKTAPAVYQLVCDRFGVSADQAVLVSSNRWDIAGARAFGMRGVWVNRSAVPDEYADLAPAAVIPSLAGL